MIDSWVFYAAALAGYLAGSIPFGLVLTKAAGIDIRQVGSGNIGATNVLRTGRKDLALATLILDSFKAGAVALVFMFAVNRDVGLIAGASAFLGHCYPVWLNFKGGKGVATYAGFIAAMSWKALIIAAPVWLGLFALTRISSLAALCAAVAAPVGAYFLGAPFTTWSILGLLSALVFWTHRENIKRLSQGKEPRFGKPKPE